MDYEGGGSFGSLNISSRGHVDTSTTDLKSTWSLYGHVENDKWTVDQFKIKVNNGEMRNGDILMAEELQPIMGEIMNSRLPRFVNELMFSNNVSVSQLFPK
ncbi:uncharacterized protein LOC106639860 [Copidosoma floridanum]|uniref:uncharacterized protein LOC106639860 n=1 Tax=Copidosoma floridanum TaxID=29053 RepID=UPI000C6FBFF6|nr:uncharacterized protein LOC106639860 [Copidosoma floridanum]